MNISRNFGALDIAPKASRQRPLDCLILFVTALVFCTSLFSLGARMHDLNVLRERRIALQKTTATLADNLRHEEAARIASAARDREREKADIELQATLHMSWDGVFDVLEAAALSVRAGTSIMSMTPKIVAPDAVEFELKALAASLPIMLAYLDALRSDPRVRVVELNMQQSDSKIGPEAIRFQLTVRLDLTRNAPYSGARGK